ncbi:MAG: nucleoside recognition family protein, partial [Burkholderiaceae bacterium]
LILSLVAITLLRSLGAIDALTRGLAPIMNALHMDTAFILPVITKYLAGGTAMMGIMNDMIKHGTATAAMVNQSAGFLVHPLDVPGVAVLISAGKRVSAVWRPAIFGAITGIIFRAIAHILFT